MILVTGGTGFIGRVLVRKLVQRSRPVRILLRPSPVSPRLPRGISVEAAVCSLRDERGLRAALKGVDVIFHLASAERSGSRADLSGVDVEGTDTLARMASDAGVQRIIYMSHLGADRSSAYPLMRAKAHAEDSLKQSGIPVTIFRSAVVYGPNDQFTLSLARLLEISPGFVLIPGEGDTLLQPFWVEDLVTCLLLAMDDTGASNHLYEVGGTEYFSFKETLNLLMSVTGVKRRLVKMFPVYLRTISVIAEHIYPRFPISLFWLDYLAADRTCALDSVPRTFGLMPARFSRQLGYLRGKQPSVMGE
ncbi:MAG: NAD(P)H-binding protein [Anaerolineaceae bacterium]|nr:NAD(P)H-binding protein [Anaerolineaceae bacterium]